MPESGRTPESGRIPESGRTPETGRDPESGGTAAVPAADGTVGIGESLVQVALPAPRTAAPPVPAPSPSDLVFTGTVSGCERWAAPDASRVEFRAPNGASLVFHAWKEDHWWGYWSMGAEISTSGGESYEAALVTASYYMTVPERTPCEIVAASHSGSRNDSHVDDSQWGLAAQQPERVAALCQAQWNGARFSEVVTAGSGCDRWKSDPWPIGFPPDWPPLPTGVEVVPSALTMSLDHLGINAARTFLVANHTQSAVAMTITSVPGEDFTYPTGSFTVPALGSLPVTVMFQGASEPGTFRTQVDVVAGGTAFHVPVTATVTVSGPNP